jgi:cytochrome c-type biogenesis protein CcmE
MTDPNPESPAGRAAPLPPGRTKWFAVGALALAGVAFFVITAGGIGKNLVYYWGPSDLQAAGDKAVGATIRLGGQVAEGSVVYGDGPSNLEFDVTDGKALVHVRSRGVPPQMFRDQIGVVVEGTMTKAGYFDCHRLMVSHNNEYRAPGDDGKKVDIKTLMRSTVGIDDAQGQSNP